MVFRQLCYLFKQIHRDEHSILFYFNFFKDFVYLFDRERETAREGTQAGRVGEGEAGFLQSREPDAGLHPRTLGSRPEPKADA